MSLHLPYRAFLRVVGLAAAVTLASVPALAREARDKVFVTPVQSAELKPAVLDVLLDRVVVAVSRARVVEVVTIEDIRAQLRQEKVKDALGCTNIACASEIAGGLGVRYLLATRAGKLGTKLVVTMSLIDTREQSSRSGQGQCADDEDQYYVAVDAAVAETLGLSQVGPQLPPPPPPACSGGMAPVGGHCCWPGQEWNSSKNACTGTPRCPNGSLTLGDACVKQPAGMRPLAGGVLHAGEALCGRGLRCDRIVEPLLMDVTEVTVEAYTGCVSARMCREPSTVGSCNFGDKARLGHPINCVSWTDASAYCAWVGKRLPSEVEWEWAARGGAKGSLYPWGDSPPGSDVCFRAVRTCSAGSDPDGASPEGIYDLAGNVWEWTSTRGNSEDDLVLRGGSWSNRRESDLGASARLSLSASAVRTHVGFRCVVAAPGAPASAAK